MLQQKLKLGLIGNGVMMRNEYLPYLEERMAKQDDLEISWTSGCLCLPGETSKCKLSSSREINGRKLGPYRQDCVPGQEDDWRSLIKDMPVDGILVSLPNNLHGDPIRAALERNVSVAVDKPTTITFDECAELV